jgi:hypothetical protein
MPGERVRVAMPAVTEKESGDQSPHSKDAAE